MRNHIKWETIDADLVMDVDVELSLVLEVVVLLEFFTLHKNFTFLEIVMSSKGCCSDSFLL